MKYLNKTYNVKLMIFILVLFIYFIFLYSKLNWYNYVFSKYLQIFELIFFCELWEIKFKKEFNFWFFLHIYVSICWTLWYNMFFQWLFFSLLKVFTKLWKMMQFFGVILKIISKLNWDDKKYLNFLKGICRR